MSLSLPPHTPETVLAWATERIEGSLADLRSMRAIEGYEELALRFSAIMATSEVALRELLLMELHGDFDRYEREAEQGEARDLARRDK